MSQNAVQVDLNKCPDEICECGSPFWKIKHIIKRIPGIMAGSTTDIYNPVQYFACELCETPHRATRITIPKYETKGDA